MTERTTDAIEFSTINRRRVTTDFLGGRLTSDAGILLLREMDRKFGLLDAINEAIPEPRDPTAITHDQRTVLAQQIFSIALEKWGLCEYNAGAEKLFKRTRFSWLLRVRHRPARSDRRSG